MSDLSELIDRNRVFAARIDPAMLAMPTSTPESMLLVLTCFDPRVEPAGFLGLTTGDAGVLRNAGGRVDSRVIEDISFLAMRFRTRMDVAIIHHTQCGTGVLAEPAFRRAFADHAGLDAADLAAKAVTEPAETVRRDVKKMLASPLMSNDVLTSVSGLVLKLETGLLETVVEAVPPGGGNAS